MKVCILGDGLTSLTLAKALVNQGIKIDIFSNKKDKQFGRNRTLGISESNINFFNKNILNIEKFAWDIKEIEIYSENMKDEKVLSFKKNKRLFSIIKNTDLINHLLSQLKKENFVKFKDIKNFNLKNETYKLIINCVSNNIISKKYFNKNFKKDYNSYAYVTIIEHEKLKDNNVASQTFTSNGPIAFLPISNKQTSVVYSFKSNKKIDIENMIRKYNKNYKIKKFNDIQCFELKSNELRKYHYKNILAFGDLLHKIHPLAGQGFNMTIRDIDELLRLVKFKIEHGLDLDNSICKDFEKNMKFKNHLFSSGIDLIYEIFNVENSTKSNIISKSIKFLGNNKVTNKFFSNIADRGILPLDY